MKSKEVAAPAHSSKWGYLQSYHGATPIGVVFRTSGGKVGSITDMGRVTWSDALSGQCSIEEAPIQSQPAFNVQQVAHECACHLERVAAGWGLTQDQRIILRVEANNLRQMFREQEEFNNGSC